MIKIINKEPKERDSFKLSQYKVEITIEAL